MTAYSNYLARQVGPSPLLGGGYDDLLGMLGALDDDDVGAGMMRTLFARPAGGQYGGGGGGGMFRRRGGGRMDIQTARRVVAQYWRSRGLAGEDDIMGALGLGGADDDTDLGDDAELAGDEDEIEGLGADDEDVQGIEGEGEALGATVMQIDRRLSRLEQRKATLEAKLMSTPPTKFRKRARLQKAIARVRELIARKQARKEKKIEIMAAKLGVPAAAVAAAAATGTATAALQSVEQQLGQAAAAKAANMFGVMSVTPNAGIEMRWPFQDTSTGSPIVNIAVTPGSGLRSASILMETPIFPYAEAEVIGLDTKLVAIQGQAAANTALASEMLVNMLLTQLLVQGGIQLMYAPSGIDLGFAGQTAGNTYSFANQGMRTLPGLRQAPALEQNNIANLAVTFRQEITNTVQIDAAFQAALVVRVTKDKQARKFMAM